MNSRGINWEDRCISQVLCVLFVVVFFWPNTSFVLYVPQFFLGQTVHHRVTPNFQVIVFLRITLLVHKYHFLPVKLVGIFQSLNK